MKEDNIGTENMRNAYRVLVVKAEGKMSLVRPRRRWEHNIKIDRREIRLGAVDLIYQVRDKDQWRSLVNTLVNHSLP
jgi:hypothetical protein